MRMVTIGQQLKTIRRILNLNQAQMCAGILSESFYSKVERGVSDVSFTKLLALLNIHNISLYDFFETFDEENLPNVKLKKEIHSAFNNRDISQLRKIKDSLDDTKSVESLKVNLMLASLNDHVYKVPEEIQENLKAKCLKVNLRQQKDFWNLAISTSLYNFSELRSLMDYILENTFTLDLTDDTMLISLMNLIINYMDRCYHEMRTDNIHEIESFVEQVPDAYAIIFHKLIVKYYLALFDKNDQLAVQIKNLLNKSGYQRYVATLPIIK